MYPHAHKLPFLSIANAPRSPAATSAILLAIFNGVVCTKLLPFVALLAPPFPKLPFFCHPHDHKLPLVSIANDMWFDADIFEIPLLIFNGIDCVGVEYVIVLPVISYKFCTSFPVWLPFPISPNTHEPHAYKLLLVSIAKACVPAAETSFIPVFTFIKLVWLACLPPFLSVVFPFPNCPLLFVP